MRRVCCTAALLAVFTASSSSAEQTDSVGPLGDPWEIEFQGVASFDPDEIREELFDDRRYLMAARPSGARADFVRRLRRCVEQGYAHAGVPAEVSVAVADRVTVTVEEETPRVFRDYAIAEGASPPPRLLERVRAADERPWKYYTHDGFALQTGAPPWTVGEPMALDDLARQEWAEHLRLCYADLGATMRGEPYELVTDAETGETDCVLTGATATEDLVIAEIEIEGLEKNAREDVLELVEVAEGDSLRFETLRRVCDRLEECCRFWLYDVSVYLPPAGERAARIAIAVTEYEPMPPLREPLAEHEEILRKAALWLARIDESEYDLVVDFEHGHWAGEVVVSPRSGAVFADVRVRTDGEASTEYRADHVFAAGPRGFRLIDRANGEQLASPSPLSFRLSASLTPTFDDEGRPKSSFRLNSKLGSNVERVIETVVKPIALIRWGETQAAPHSLDDGVLTLAFDNGRGSSDLRIDAATGRLLSWRGADEQDNPLRITAARGALRQRRSAARERYESYPDRYDEAAPWRSSLAFLADQARRQPAIASKDQLSNVVDFLASRAVAEVLADVDGRAQQRKQRHEFAIPGDAGASEEDDWRRPLLRFFPTAAKRNDRLFEPDSWPTTLLYESRCGSFGEGPPRGGRAGFRKEIDRLLARDDSGPIFCFAMVLTSRNDLVRATRFANRGLELIDDEAALERELAVVAVDDAGDRDDHERFLAVIAEFGKLDRSTRRFLIAYPLRRLGKLGALLVSPLDEFALQCSEAPEATLGEILRETIRVTWRTRLREDARKLFEAVVEKSRTASAPRRPKESKPSALAAANSRRKTRS